MRIAIVEDEAIVARRLERAVRAALGVRVTRLDVLPTLAAAREHVGRQALDLVFLDLNLNGRDGFDLLAEAVARPFPTIVVSAHEDQALRAFEHGVVDFVPKPWTDARLRRALDRAVGRGAPAPGRAVRLALRRGGAIEFVELARVVAIRGADDYAELLLAGGETRLHEKTLAELARVLPAEFVRTHRSWIVNLAHVRAWAAAPGGRATLELEALEVPVGRTFRAAVLARLGAAT